MQKPVKTICEFVEVQAVCSESESYEMDFLKLQLSAINIVRCGIVEKQNAFPYIYALSR